jgi:predicted metal-binding membrane protein
MRYSKAVMSEAAGHDFNHLPRGAAGLGHVFARPKLVAVLSVLVLAVLGWVYLGLLLAGMGGSFGGYASGMVQTLCRPLPDGTWSAGGIAIIVSMWGAMTLAMMLPSAAPMIVTYAGIADTAACKGERIVSPLVLAAGYTVVWLGFAFIATLAQITVTRAALLMPAWHQRADCSRVRFLLRQAFISSQRLSMRALRDVSIRSRSSLQTGQRPRLAYSVSA